MKAYLDLVKNVLENGVRKENRTGTDTISNFAEFYKVDLSEGFPLLTTKKVFFRSVILELLWYLRGEDHIRWLRDENDCHIWDAWADEDGHVGPIYPVLWRRFPYLEKENVNLEGTGGAVESETWVRKEFDQVQRAIDMLKTNPNSRRIVVSTWHPGLLAEMALPPCHIMYIFNVSNGKLNCHLTQRSGDIALGIPFNLACYSALTMAIAQEVGLEPGTFAHTIVDAHIYVNHVDGLKEQLKREPRELPTLEIAKKPVDELTFDDFKLHNYDPDPVIKFEVCSMILTIVVAHDPNLVIGKEGGLPWRYPEDLKHFKQTTLGGTMIMGRGVFEELNEIPLPGRKNIVLTRTKTYDNVDTYTSLQIALDELDEEEIFIIGGGVLYRDALPMADKMIVTQVNKEYDGDTYFPEYRDDIGKTWVETDRRETDDLTFLVFERA